MPAQERSLRIDGRDPGGDQSYHQRRHREAMAGKTSPQESHPPADVQPSPLDDADWDQDHDEAAGHRARRLLSRSNSSLHRFGDYFGALRRWLAGERWVRRLAIAIVVPGGDFRRQLRRPVVAAWCGSDQSRNGHAVAGRGDRGQYRPRQHRRGRRHANRACRQNPHRRPHPRHHCPGSRPRHRGERAEGRGEAVGHRAADGTPARREPQSGGCRTRGANHPGRLCHGFHR